MSFVSDGDYSVDIKNARKIMEDEKFRQEKKYNNTEFFKVQVNYYWIGIIKELHDKPEVIYKLYHV